jgi:RNase P/RNase MRP subunit p30
MVYDIQLPKNNEQKLIKESLRLGINKIIFLYPFTKKTDLTNKKKENNALGKNIYTGILLKPGKVNDISRFPKSLFYEADFIAAQSVSEKIVRAIVSQPKIDLLVNPETHTGKDHTHFRYSNINQVLAKLSRANTVRYGVDFHRLLKLEPKHRVKLIGRIMQNIRIFQKYKVPLVIGSFASKPEDLRNMKDLAALLRVLGSKYKESKLAIHSNLKAILEEKELHRSPEYVRPGVKVVS